MVENKLADLIFEHNEVLVKLENELAPKLLEILDLFLNDRGWTVGFAMGSHVFLDSEGKAVNVYTSDNKSDIELISLSVLLNTELIISSNSISDILGNRGRE